jgi:tetratricopeptide (TPR) repeat protein
MLVLALLWTAPAAVANAQPVTELKRGEAEQAYRRGGEAMRSEAFEEAAREFTTAGRLDPMFAMAFYSLGQARMALRQYPQAVAAYESCRSVFEKASTLSGQERTVLERQREDELHELRDSLQRVNAGKIKGGSVVGLQVRLEERIRMLESSRQRGNENTGGVPAEVSLALGSARFRAGQLPEAQQDYEAAVAADPSLGAAHNNLAVLYMLAGRYDQARDAVRKAEKAGVSVSLQFKEDLERRAKSTP